MNIVIISLVILGGVGLVAAVVLAVASRIFFVKTDPRIEEIENILPGANCAGCGFPSCHTYAENIVEGGAEPNRCVLCAAEGVGKISSILGIEATTAEKKVAAIHCYGGKTAAKAFEYGGIPSCRAASLYSGGDTLCTYSCLGFGDCVSVCPFGALSRSGREAPQVDRERCTGCGNCVKVCPKEVISLIPRKGRIFVGCNSYEKGKTVRKICEVGCIKCNRCIKNCPEGALSMQDERVCVDYEKCTGCGTCIEECPRNIIIDTSHQQAEIEAVNQ
jgi:Na+-translocating ferredoxin:NAD+ oxidoreductase RNF subunit RnfB